MTIFPHYSVAGALALLAMTAGPLAAQDSPAAPETATTETATTETAPTGTAPTESAEAAATETAVTETAEPADCAALQVLSDGIPDAQKALTLAEQGLATSSNVTRAYNELGDAVAKSLDDIGYQTSCYLPVLSAVKDSATPDIDGVTPTAVSDKVVASWAEQCEAMTDVEGVSTCLSDTAEARADDYLTETQTVRLVNALPLETVSFDEAQMTEFLTLVKEQVEAGTLSTSQQDSIVEKLLNQ